MKFTIDAPDSVAMTTEAPAASTPRRQRLQGSPQQEAFWTELIEGSRHLLLEARAGTGKSTSAREGMWRLLEARPDRAIRYTCFNKKIAEEFAAKCPPGVEVGTMHRFGLQALQRAFDCQIDEFKSYTLLDTLEGGAALKRYVRKSIATLVSHAKNHGLAPDDPQLAMRLAEFCDVYDVETWRQQDLCIRWARKVLCCAAETTSLVDFDDMLWLPVLHGVRFPDVDFLFIDEAQDLSHIQHRLAVQMSGSGRTVIIADPHQCQPAGTIVALTGGERKPIENVIEGDEVISLNRPSGVLVGRISQGHKITATACRPFSGNLLTITVGDHQTRCTPNHKWITRFADRLPNHCVTYLMRRDNRFRVGWCQLFRQRDSMLHLGHRTRIERADAAWIIGLFANRTDASVHESIIAAKFGLPTIPFEPVEGAQHITKDAIDRIFAGLSPVEHFNRAVACLNAHGRDIEHPFYDADFRQRQGRTTIFTTQACNLIPGLMMVPVYTGDREPLWTTIDRIDRNFVLDLPVYSLQVADHETYVADGLVTHNSIYGWRGADSESTSRMRAILDAMTLPLTVTFRCPRSHVERARQLVPDFEAAPDAPEGELIEGPAYLIDEAVPGDLVLCRANAPIIAACLRLVAARRPAIVRGRKIGDSLIAVVRKLGDPPTIPEFARAVSVWRAKEIARLEAKDGTDFLIEETCDRADCLDALASACDSPAEIPGLITRLFDDSDAANRVTFSSVHRAKGSEARRVMYLQIPYGEQRDRARPPQPWELAQRRNLRYVALTRSLHSLTLVS